MHIRLQIDGGFGYFPGLGEPVVVDTADLSPSDAEKLESLVRQADFFDRTDETAAAPPGAADLRRYTISVDGEGRSRTLEVVDPVDDPALRHLIDSVRDVGRAGADR